MMPEADGRLRNQLGTSSCTLEVGHGARALRCAILVSQRRGEELSRAERVDTTR